MVYRTSKYLLGYTVDSDLENNDLFPNVFVSTKDESVDISGPQENNQDISREFDDIEDDDDANDIANHNIFRRPSLLKDNVQHEVVTDNEIETIEDFEDDTSNDVRPKQRNVFKSNFDTDSEGGDIYSIRSSIVGKITDSMVNNIDSTERFKMLTLYEQAYKLKQMQQLRGLQETEDGIPLHSMESNSSVFHLSELEDFTKFVKMTELNDLIYSKYEKSKPDQDNLLDVIKSRELGANFYVEKGNGNSPKVSSVNKTLGIASGNKRWFNLDWPKLKNIDHSLKSSDNYFNDATPVSSTSSEKTNNKYLIRTLKVRHLQMISFGGTLGVGLFLNSGKALNIAGGFGALLAFAVCGLIVLATIVSFCEMVTFVSIVDGVSGLSSRFVDDAFGFATGWLYFFSYAFGLAGEIVASVIMLAYYPQLKILDNKGSVAGFVTLFLTSVILSNIINVQVFGELEYISSFIKLFFIVLMLILMIILNRGGFGGEALGFKYWQYSKSDFDHNLIFGLFRPTFNLNDNGTNSPNEGIGGDLGRFMSLMVAITVVSFAYSGTEIVCIAACEAKDPRKALPSATKRVFWRIILFYCLTSFLVSLNLYAGDPRLLRYYSGATGVSINELSSNYAVKYVGGAHCNSESALFAGFASGSQSPLIVAFQSVNLCELSSVINGFLVFFAVSCGNAQLYVSSRTMYSLALQGKAPRFLSKCNRHGIPYYSVAFSASFGLLAFLCINEQATVVFLNLSNIIASSGIIVWFSMCLSYIRFYYGLKKRPDIISRDDPSYPYKSFFQPYTAFIGLFGSLIIMLGMGYTTFLLGYWDTLSFFAYYGTLILFVLCFVIYKFVYDTRMPSLETLDFDSGRREMDRYIWDGNKDYNQRNIKDVFYKWVSFLA